MIEYTGKILLEHKWHSSYLLGYVDTGWLIYARANFYEDYFHDQNEGLLHYKIVSKYIKEELPVLRGWLRETETPFGGFISDMEGGRYFSCYSLKLLLDPGSIQETAFRLCFGVKAASL